MKTALIYGTVTRLSSVKDGKLLSMRVITTFINKKRFTLISDVVCKLGDDVAIPALGLSVGDHIVVRLEHDENIWVPTHVRITYISGHEAGEFLDELGRNF